jgi:hypothetical protein
MVHPYTHVHGLFLCDDFMQRFHPSSSRTGGFRFRLSARQEPRPPMSALRALLHFCLLPFAFRLGVLWLRPTAATWYPRNPWFKSSGEWLSASALSVVPPPRSRVLALLCELRVSAVSGVGWMDGGLDWRAGARSATLTRPASGADVFFRPWVPGLAPWATGSSPPFGGWHAGG